jgi:hypothetical protein
LVGLLAGCAADTASSQADDPSSVATASPTEVETPQASASEEAVSFTGDVADLLAEAADQVGSIVHVTGTIGTVAEGVPVFTMTDDAGRGEIAVIVDPTTSGGDYTLIYPEGEAAQMTGRLVEFTAENIDSLEIPLVDGQEVVDLLGGVEYLLIPTGDILIG